MPQSQNFDSVVFAGGGNRCAWQAGWWERVAPEIGLQPRVVAGVSAGAAMARTSTAELLIAITATPSTTSTRVRVDAGVSGSKPSRSAMGA